MLNKIVTVAVYGLNLVYIITLFMMGKVNKGFNIAAILMFILQLINLSKLYLDNKYDISEGINLLIYIALGIVQFIVGSFGARKEFYSHEAVFKEINPELSDK